MVALTLVALFFALQVDPAKANAPANAPANDDFEDARILKGDSASIRGSNEFAARENGESDHIISGSSLGRRSVWYRWTAWESGAVEADVCESDFDAILAVYTRNGDGELEQVADNDDGCRSRNPRGSSLAFEAEFQETYWISVSGYSNASTGTFRLKLSPELPPNTRDDTE